MTPNERKKYAQMMFAQYPHLFTEERQQSILRGIITLGMTPFEARLAGGAFTYKVIADKATWSKNADPLQVMWAQSIKVDNSQIWMIFKNQSQFCGDDYVSFRVYFEHGCAAVIEKLDT